MNKADKLILCAIIFFGLCFKANSQVQFNIKGGLNYTTNESLDSDLDRRYISRFHVGLASNFRLGEKVSLEPELLYSRKGYGYEVSIFDGFSSSFEKGKTLLDYLAFPVLMSYAVSENLKVSAGPEIAYLVSGKSRIFNVTRGETEFF